jgi:hypothetical protein
LNHNRILKNIEFEPHEYKIPEVFTIACTSLSLILALHLTKARFLIILTRKLTRVLLEKRLLEKRLLASPA